MKLPSIGLTQLKQVLDETFGDQVSTELHYLNLDFARFFGPVTYNFLANDTLTKYSGYGEWLFRHIAFPEAPDNRKALFDRFQLGDGPADPAAWTPFSKELRFYAPVLEPKRLRMEAFLDQLILDNGLHTADLIGFTSLFGQNLPNLALARRIKHFNPSATIVMGGANCESPMGEELIRQFEVLDYAFSGKALISFPAFVGALLNKDAEACLRIDGVFHRDNLDRIAYSALERVGKQKEMIGTLGKELDPNQIIGLDYDAFLDRTDEVFAGTPFKPYLLFETSRGCWWGEKAHCTFCGLNGNTMKFTSVESERARSFLGEFFERYIPRATEFGATDNIMPKDMIEEVFSYLDLPEEVTLFYEIKADLKPAQLATMAASRITTVQPGIESIDASILKLMRKGATGTSNVAFLREAGDVGIFCFWNLLIGFPGESEAPYHKYVKDFPALYHLTPPKDVYMIRFDRYSPYFTQQEVFGLELTPMAYHQFLYPEMDAESLHNLAYFFEDKRTDAPYHHNVRNWFHAMRKAVKMWNDRYSVRDDKPAPQLYCNSAGDSVYDSRSGEVIHLPLQPAHHHLLELLRQPVSKVKLQSAYRNLGLSDFDTHLQYLMDHQLVFHEEGRTLVSLLTSVPLQSN